MSVTQTHNKETLVLIPGIGCNQGVWSRQVDGLSDLVDIIVPDITPYDSIQEMAEAILAQVPARFYLVGFSLGGWVALQIAEIARERVIKLALLASPEYSLMRRSLLADGEKRIEGLGFEKYLNAVYQQYVSPVNYQNTELKDRMLSMMRTVGKDAIIRGINALLHQDKPFAYEKLQGLSVLIIDGKDDVRIPSESNAKLAEKIQGAKAVILPEAGHFVSMEQPDKLNQILRDWIK